MNKVFVDTNLFLRYLTNDIPEKASLLETLLKQAESGQLKLIINSLVIAEIVWKLQSYYKFPKKKIDETVSSIVASHLFAIPERDILLQSLEDFNILNIDFIDAYIGNWMKNQGIHQIYTLNQKDFRRIPGINICPLK
jgi:uncharacterized protein